MDADMVEPGPTAGAASGCQFCVARTAPPLARGERFRVLTADVHALGATGTALENTGNGQTALRVALDGDQPGTESLIDLKRVLLERLPGTPPAPWALPIPQGYAEHVDLLVVNIAAATNWLSIAVPDWERIYALIHYIWDQQLPIYPEELQTVLAAHGIPETRCRELASIFDHGRNLLMLTKQKPPRKTRRLAEAPR